MNAIKLIDHFSPEGRAALAEIQEFIRSHDSSDALDERAYFFSAKKSSPQ